LYLKTYKERGWQLSGSTYQSDQMVVVSTGEAEKIRKNYHFQKKLKIFFLFLICSLVLSLASFYILKKSNKLSLKIPSIQFSNTDGLKIINFNEVGYLEMQGLIGGWSFSYGQNIANPDRSVDLTFSAKSVCIVNQEEKLCNQAKLEHGLKIKLQGTIKKDIVEVTTIKTIE